MRPNKIPITLDQLPLEEILTKNHNLLFVINVQDDYVIEHVSEEALNQDLANELDELLDVPLRDFIELKNGKSFDELIGSSNDSDDENDSFYLKTKRNIKKNYKIIFSQRIDQNRLLLLLKPVSEKHGPPSIQENVIHEKESDFLNTQSKAFLDAIPDHLSMIDGSYNLVWVNKTATKIFGTQIIGKKCHVVYHGSDTPCKECIVRKTFEDCKQHEHTTTVLTKENKKRTFWCTSNVVKYSESGKPDLVLEVSRDITDFKITEKRVYQELTYRLNKNFLHFKNDFAHNLQLLLNTFKELLKGCLAIFVNRVEHEDDQGVHYEFISSNGDSLEVSEQDFNDYIASDIMNQSHELPQIIINLQMTRFITTDSLVKDFKITSSYGKLIFQDNKRIGCIYILFESEPQISQEAQFMLFMISHIIENERNRWVYNRHMQKQNEMLIELDKYRSELLNRTSHELKTPLISIRGFTDLLLNNYNQGVGEKFSTLVEQIKKGCVRLESTVRDLIESSQLERNEIELNLSLEKLDALLHNCVDKVIAMASERDQSIIFKIQDGVELYVDGTLLFEAINNILINAIKFTPRGGLIEIHSELKEAFYIISIKDEGIGLTKEEQSKLFQQFGKIERYGQGFDVDIGGTGLGLYITKKIIDLHEGKVIVQSEGRNKGSCFTISIPTTLRHES